MNADLIKRIIEGALLAAGKPLDIARLKTSLKRTSAHPAINFAPLSKRSSQTAADVDLS